MIQPSDASIAQHAATDDAPVLRVRGLRKAYGELIALDAVDLDIRAGEIFGLLGPNGAGKSTAISCICGLLKPSGGSIRVRGHDVVARSVEARRSLGVVPQELALFDDLSGRRNVAYWASAYGLRGSQRRERVDAILEAVALIDRADDKVETYSGGMKRRLNFACGVVHRPQLLLLDEPTAAVDPQSRRKLLDLVKAQAERGTSVLYTTHYMEEAQALCDRLAIIDHGRIIADGTLDELRQRSDERDVLTLRGTFPDASAQSLVAALSGVELIRRDEEALVLALRGAPARLPELLQRFADAEMTVREVTLAQPNLESLFLRLTGRALRT
ncbi:MAG: ABC transporter ATP-binding protein [Acidobacteriota bacterium]